MSLLTRFQLFLKSVHRSYRFLIAGIYLLGFLILGEVHPFSSYPMYNSFPNWSYTFYFTDENDSLIPSDEFDLSSGAINHKFYAICKSERINYGHGKESKSELFSIGEKMTEMIIPAAKKMDLSIVRLHRIHFKYVKGKVVKIDRVIYEKIY